MGHALVQKLLQDGCGRICIYSRNEHRQFQMMKHFGSDKRLRFFIGDVRDLRRLERAMSSVYSVIHAAALKRIEVGAYNPDEMVKTNVEGSMNVIEAGRRLGIAKTLLVSSDKAYQPISPYGQTKALAESLFLQANDPGIGPKFSVVRYGNVVGSTGSVIPRWREAKAKNEGVTVTDPECTRFWMTRQQAATLVVDTLVAMNGGELAVPTLPAFRLGDLAEAMEVEYEVTGLPRHEKMHENMDDVQCSKDAPRMSVEDIRRNLPRAA